MLLALFSVLPWLFHLESFNMYLSKREMLQKKESSTTTPSCCDAALVTGGKRWPWAFVVFFGWVLEGWKDGGQKLVIRLLFLSTVFHGSYGSYALRLTNAHLVGKKWGYSSFFFLFRNCFVFPVTCIFCMSLLGCIMRDV